MNYQLDTQAVIWFINGDERVPLPIRDAERDPKNTVSITIVSLWEIAIKRSILTFPVIETMLKVKGRARIRFVTAGRSGCYDQKEESFYTEYQGMQFVKFG